MIATVTLTLDDTDGAGQRITTGRAIFTPSMQLRNAVDHQRVTRQQIVVPYGTEAPTVDLYPNDSADLLPSGWKWCVRFEGMPEPPVPFVFDLASSPAEQNLADLTPLGNPAASPAYFLAGQYPGDAAKYLNGVGQWKPPPISGSGALLADRGGISPETQYSPGDLVAYKGQRVLITEATESSESPNWFTPARLTAGTYLPVTSEGMFYAADWGVVADGVTDNAPALNKALQYMYQGDNGGGFLVLPPGYTPSGQVVGVSSTVIVPPGCFIVGQGIETSCIRLNPGANCDVIQFQTFNSESQAEIISAATGITTSLGSLRNAFYAGLIHLCVHGNKTHQDASTYKSGVSMVTNPLTTAAGTDPDFDPSNLLLDVEIRSCTGDGLTHAGRGQFRAVNLVSRYNNGWGCVPSFDSLYTGCNFGENGIGGIYLNHASVNGSACKAFNNGAAPQWTSGVSYAANTAVMHGGVLFCAIHAVADSATSPDADPSNWAQLAATAPEGWGAGFYFDEFATENTWTACDGQENGSTDFWLHQCSSVAIQGVSSRPAYQAAVNPSHWSSLALDGASGCIADVGFSGLNDIAYALRITAGAERNDLRMAGDTSYAEVLSPDSITLPGSGNRVAINGADLSGSPSSPFLCAPVQYAPAAQILPSTTTQAMSAVSSGNIHTGSFTAPESGSVIVTASFMAVASVNAENAGFGLCARGTTSPVLGNVIVIPLPSTTSDLCSLRWLVTGLTPGDEYDLDLVWCIASGFTATMKVLGQSSATPALNNAGTGAPAVMTVQAA